MQKPFKVKNISVSIFIPYPIVYEYISEPKNFPEWASGLCKSIEQGTGQEWVLETPQGKLKAVFTPKNEYGILDHTVLFDNGQKVENPMRVIRNGEGCEILFTLFQTPDMSLEKFEEDANWVQKDLNELKTLVEKKFG
ncbi:SRPBCC family protein [Leptospira sp. WS92.C1]